MRLVGYEVPEVETDRLLLRGWSDEDLPDLERLWLHPLVRRALRTPTASRDHVRIGLGRMRRHWETRGFGYWALTEKESGRVIGTLGLEHLDDWPLEHKVEVGWVLHPFWWGRGLATEGGSAVVRFGMERAGLDRIISTAFPDHGASRRVMEKCGLAYQGTLFWQSRRHHVVWYAIDRD